MSRKDKPLVWLHGEVKSPPLSKAARLEGGYLLRVLQSGRNISMPHSRPMPLIGKSCHELRITDVDKIWRLVYRIDSDAIVIVAVFQKKTGKTPNAIIDSCKSRLRNYSNESS